MKIVTWETKNFGDCLNEIVWPHFIPDYLDIKEEYLLYGIGSLINHRLPVSGKKIFLGTGYGHGEPPILNSDMSFLWVRGPLTARVLSDLGAKDVRYIADGAILLREIFDADVEKLHDTSFIPHCGVNVGGLAVELRDVCHELGVNYIDVNDDVSVVVAQIKASKRVITEALHGAIVADTFGVPWLPVFRRGVLPFKWHDYCQSMGGRYSPVSLPYRPSLFDQRGVKGVFKKPLAKFSLLALKMELLRLLSSDGYQLTDRGTISDKILEIKSAIKFLR